MNDQGAAQYGATDVKPVKGADVATGVTNCCAQVSEGTWDIVELAIEADGESCGWKSCHKALRLRNRMSQNMTIYEIA
jgi:hypothetical protein